jgi:hypothetical protein
MISNDRERLLQEACKALRCLHIAVDASVANDVASKVEAVVSHLLADLDRKDAALRKILSREYVESCHEIAKGAL